MGSRCLRMQREKPIDWLRVARRVPNMAPFIFAMLEENKKEVMTPTGQRIRMTELYSVELKAKRDAEVLARDEPEFGLVAKQQLHDQNARIQVRKCRTGSKTNGSDRSHAMNALRELLAAKRAVDACNQRIAKYDGMIADPEILIRAARDSQDKLIHSDFHEAMNLIGWLNVDKAEDDHDKSLDNAAKMKDMKELREAHAEETGKLYNGDEDILAAMFEALLNDGDADLLEPPSRIAAPSMRSVQSHHQKTVDDDHNMVDHDMEELIRTQPRGNMMFEQEQEAEEASGSDENDGASAVRMSNVRLDNRNNRSKPIHV